jgi:hypothetical protein
MPDMTTSRARTTYAQDIVAQIGLKDLVGRDDAHQHVVEGEPAVRALREARCGASILLRMHNTAQVRLHLCDEFRVYGGFRAAGEPDQRLKWLPDQPSCGSAAHRRSCPQSYRMPRTTP